MEQNSERGLAMKTFAIVGFTGLIIFLVWLAVQIVSLIPSAFSSLASLADGIYNNRAEQELVVSNGNSIVANGEAFTINWTSSKKAGTYTFGYVCAEGVSLDIRHPGNSITSVTCGETINLGDSIFSLEAMARAEKRRFTDITYTIGFVPQDKSSDGLVKDVIVTIVNANIPQGLTVDTPIVDEPVVTVPEVETPVAEKPVTPSTPLPPVYTKPVYTTTYTIPKSDPNGFIDLAVKFIAVGTMNNSNVFTPVTKLDNDDRGAFQFEVKNIGTKTSNEWTFVATLPSGDEFVSVKQAALKPNERSVITLGFDTVGNAGSKNIGAVVSTTNDKATNNNGFNTKITVVN